MVQNQLSPCAGECKITGVQGIFSDISQSKHLEKQLQRAHKMEALGFLASGVARDLNNILCGIVRYPDLLLRDLPDNSPLRAPLFSPSKPPAKKPHPSCRIFLLSPASESPRQSC
jgi:hypothetical protein